MMLVFAKNLKAMLGLAQKQYLIKNKSWHNLISSIFFFLF